MGGILKECPRCTLSPQEAGAVGVIVVNTVDDGGLIGMAKDGTKQKPSIPTVMVSRTTGALLLRAIRENANGQMAMTATLMYEPFEPLEQEDEAGSSSGGDSESEVGCTAENGVGSLEEPTGRSVAEGDGLGGQRTDNVAEGETSEPSVESPLSTDADSSRSVEERKDGGDNSAKGQASGVEGQCPSEPPKEPDQQQGGRQEGEQPAHTQLPQPRLDMLVPTSSHPFVVANMLQRWVTQ